MATISNIYKVEEIIGYSFKNKPRLLSCLTISSKCTNAMNGDAILGHLVVEILFQLFPNISPRQLNRLAAKIVSNCNLKKRVINLGLNSFISGTCDKITNHNIGDVFESLVSAVLIDSEHDYIRVISMVFTLLVGPYINVYKLECCDGERLMVKPSTLLVDNTHVSHMENMIGYRFKDKSLLISAMHTKHRNIDNLRGRSLLLHLLIEICITIAPKISRYDLNKFRIYMTSYSYLELRVREILSRHYIFRPKIYIQAPKLFISALLVAIFNDSQRNYKIVRDIVIYLLLDKTVLEENALCN